jgi:hypothetical protein
MEFPMRIFSIFRALPALALLVVSLLSLSPAYAFEVSAPDLTVGSWWTYVRHDLPSGSEVERYTNTIVGKTDTLYNIVRTNSSGAVIAEYAITRNLGQGTPIDGNIGDGNQISFPLIEGKKWTTRSYFVNVRGFKGRNDTDYKVVGIDDVAVPAGTFRGAVKIQGSGLWSGISQPGSGALDEIVHYSEIAGVQVRVERTNRGLFDRSEIVLIAYERK